MQPLRANSPVDDLGVLNPIEDEQSPTDLVSPEHKVLAKASKSKDGKIILDHLKKRIDDYTQTLLHTNYADKDPVLTAASVMASQAVIKEFEAVLRDVDISNQAVSDAARASRR